MEQAKIISSEVVRARQAAESTRSENESRQTRDLERETLIGKSIFYITVALSIWFFYWLNGIQCPC
ncbi:MAG: hypothetical protein C4293_00435 [Nitrospiraceae bacterium]